MSSDEKNWTRRERKVCGPGSNRSRAKARLRAKTTGNRAIRRRQKEEDRREQ